MKRLALLLALALPSYGWAACPANVVACYFCTAAQDGSDLCGGSAMTISGTFTYDAIGGPTVLGVQSTAVSGFSATNYGTLPAAVSNLLAGASKNSYSIEMMGYVTGYGNYAMSTYNAANALYDFTGVDYLTGLMRWGGIGGITTGNTAIALNSWKNQAFDWNGTTRVHYYNGSSDGTSASSATYQSGTIRIGSYTNGNPLAFATYLSRIVILNASSSTHPSVIVAPAANNTDKRGLSLKSVLRERFK